MTDYHINIFFSEEDGGYIADVPDLETCSAFGLTPAEALKELLAARAGWVQAAETLAKPVPSPTYRPFIYQF